VYVHNHNLFRTIFELNHLSVFLLGILLPTKAISAIAPPFGRYFVSFDVTFYEDQPFYPNTDRH